MQVSIGITRTVIESDSQPTRFEAFANAVVSLLEGGAPVISTSASWDVGRDGRSVGRAVPIIVCASLRDDVDRKARSDIEKIVASNRLPEKVYFCSARRLSESGTLAIEATLRDLLPDHVGVQVLGSTHLADCLTAADPDILRRFYPGEVEDCIRTFEGGEQDGEAESLALQLALSTVGHTSSSAIRAASYRAAVRAVLSDRAPRPLQQLCQEISDRLRLGRILPGDAVAHHILTMGDEITITAETYRLTEQGAREAEKDRERAAAELLRGRNELRSQIEKECGSGLADQHYAALWAVLQEKLTQFFYLKGREMVAAICAVLGEADGDKPGEGKGERPFFVEELAEAAAATSKNADLREELKTAIVDIFSEHVGPAFDWLVSACAAFVTLCTLGVEAQSGEQLRRLIGSLELALDTDVVLSLLGDGEPEHPAVLEIVKRWRRLGGALLLAQPVAEEVAYHAWIADQDYRQVESWLPGSELDRVRYVENVFVRSFASLLAARKTKKRFWTSYIRHFRGNEAADARRIAQLLREEYGFGELPAAGRAGAVLRRKAEDYLGDRISRDLGGRKLKIARDKAKRDAELYAALRLHADAIHAADARAGCFLATSSGRLAQVEKALGGREAGLVLSISSVLHLLSMVPGVSVGMTAMRALLFDGRTGSHPSEVQRTLLRVIRESEEMSLPYGKRTVLAREIQHRILDIARAEGARGREVKTRAAELEREIADGRKPEVAVAVLKGALDKVAVSSRADRELGEARREIERLKAELAVARRER
jgi:hypothetical protein